MSATYGWWLLVTLTVVAAVIGYWNLYAAFVMLCLVVIGLTSVAFRTLLVLQHAHAAAVQALHGEIVPAVPDEPLMRPVEDP